MVKKDLNCQQLYTSNAYGFKFPFEENLTSGSLARSDTNQAVQPPKIGRGLTFRI